MNDLITVREEVVSLSERIRALLPGGNRLTPQEAQSLAQVALLHGLDPFNGEVWYLKDKSGNSLGVTAGIKGHRRAAHRQIDKQGGNYWCEFDQLSPDEKKALAMPENAIAFRCRLFDSVSIRLYTETIERLCKAGVPWESVKELVGERPYNVGYGFYTPGELTKMKPAACGMKRAEADALKRRFDLPFGSAVGAPQDADEHVFQVTDGVFESAETPAQIQSKMQTASRSLRGDQGDFEPEYHSANEPEQPTQTEEPTAPEQVKSPVMPEVTSKPAANKCAAFTTWCNTWAKKHPEYLKEDGMTANMWHVTARVGKLGFSEVTDNNKGDVIAALESFAAGKVDPLHPE